MSTIKPTIHVFERAGLGKAPYAYLGSETRIFRAVPDAPAQPGASCNYCGTGITQVYKLRSADGREFHVGCDCILKAGDEGLRRDISADVRRAESEKRHARATLKADQVRAWLNEPAVTARLASLPHPYDWARAKGQTLLDYTNWTFKNSGDAGRTKLHKRLKNMVEGVRS